MCTSALSVTGLSSTLVAPLTTWQQVILYVLLQVGSLPAIALMTLVVRRTKFVRRLREDERRGLFEKGEVDAEGSEAGEEPDNASIVHRGSSSALSFPRPTGRGGYPNPLAGVFNRIGRLLHRPRASRRAAGSSADYLLDGMTSVRNSHFMGVRSEKHRAHVRHGTMTAG